MKILLGADHGGVDLKNELAERLQAEGHEICDAGVCDHTSVDYPDIAEKVCRELLAGGAERALLFCGTGLGISMAANKIGGIRAAAVSDCFSARMARQHNNANVLCLGGRTLGPELAVEIVHAYLAAEFEGGRHARRVGKIDALGER